MKIKKNLLIIGVVVVVCLATAQFALSLQDRHHSFDNNYLVDTEITTPEYQTDTSRVINAYERLMDKYMDLAKASIAADRLSASQKLESIDVKLSDLSARLSRIEKALGIDPNSQKPETKVKK
jgi:predicted Ser/Thr protein kinase